MPIVHADNRQWDNTDLFVFSLERVQKHWALASKKGQLIVMKGGRQSSKNSIIQIQTEIQLPPHLSGKIHSRGETQ